MMNNTEVKNRLQRFDSTTLAYAIQKAFPFLFQNTDQLRQELDKYVFPRLDFLAEIENHQYYFLFEEHYVETEWKDMISMHYINTSYEVVNTVMRIHLFLEEEMNEQPYMGCFTMRTIDEPHIMLSYIYPNWKYVTYDDRPLNIMTYQKEVHINGKEIIFNTYPLFVQDNAVVTCAQACLVSMSKYLHSRYDYNRIRIGKIDDSYHSNKTKAYPSQGLLPTQMLEILNSHDIPCGYQMYNDPAEFKEYIDYCVESAIPVLVGLRVKENGNSKKAGSHVIQIIGHSDVETQKRYVIYDDSGYYLKKLEGNGFVECISWEVLSSSLEKNKSFIIYSIHEKVYIYFENFKMRMNDMLFRTKMDAMMDVDGKNGNRRILLIDNREAKRFLQENMACDVNVRQDVREEAGRLLQIDMPHYLWCCEYSTAMGNMLFLADPTYNRRTTKNIFLNKVPLICKSQIGLLNYV